MAKFFNNERVMLKSNTSNEAISDYIVIDVNEEMVTVKDAINGKTVRTWHEGLLCKSSLVNSK